MSRPLSREQIRRIDELATSEYGIPGLILMENAGLHLCAATLRFLKILKAPVARPVVIACGRGNNGGDGFVLARHLHNAQREPLILLLGAQEPAPGDAATNLLIVRRMGLKVIPIPDTAALARVLEEPAALLVDAYLGTGVVGALKAESCAFIEAMNASGFPILAVDIPSGLDCDQGLPLGAAIRARRTVTMAALKLGFAVPGAEAFTGQVELVSIGAPRELIERAN